MIQSFADADTRSLWETGKNRRLPPNLRRVALRKLLMLHGAGKLADLRTPPGNRLERLSGDRDGQHSIRVNDQYRICFVWKSDGAREVEITDYH
ncbi:MAG TPA: type II toxin-antitoxin system RelE/ParE family toxin [Candidatus Acidoferrales bacterium]|nr:type II toxin-antitoxin system RelE/ParE family toxin [Candidatus Acidoferrales bacterium]